LVLLLAPQSRGWLLPRETHRGIPARAVLAICRRYVTLARQQADFRAVVSEK
jgi:hypothetical protein